MPLDRRTFLMQSAGVAVAGALTSAARAQTPVSGSDLLAGMTWLNEPLAWNVTRDGLTARPRPRTDFWRETFNGVIADNGHFFHRTAAGEFTFEAWVFGKYASPYDQAGILVRQNSESWMKCGTEFFEGRRHASVVFTRDFSDWSTMPDVSEASSVCWRAVRHRNSLEVYASPDGEKFSLVRSGYFPPSNEAEAGIYCCAPQGDGFDCVFDDLKLS